MLNGYVAEIYSFLIFTNFMDGIDIGAGMASGNWAVLI